MAKLSEEEIAELTETVIRVAKRTRRELREQQGIRLTPMQFLALTGTITASLVQKYLDRTLEPDYPEGDPRRRLN